MDLLQQEALDRDSPFNLQNDQNFKCQWLPLINVYIIYIYIFLSDSVS